MTVLPGVLRRRARRRGVLLAVLLLLSAVLVIPLSRILRKPEPPPPPASRPIRVEVLNGCGVPGTAERVASRLRAGKFLVERTGNAAEFGHTEDLVIARTKDRGAMEEVARYLAVPARIVQRNETADVDVTVIVGRPR